MKTNNHIIDTNQVTGNILVVLPKFLGDAVNCTPSLQLLKKLYPKQKIILLVRPNLAEMFKREQSYSVIIDERFNNTSNVSIFSLAKILQTANIQLAILMRNSLSEAVLCFLAHIKFRVGYAKNGRSPLLTHKLKLNPNHHYIYRYCRLVNECHGSPFNTIPNTELFSNETTLINVHNKKNIGIYFGGTNKSHRHYPHDLANQAINQIAENSKECFFYILGDSNEQQEAQQLASSLAESNITTKVLAAKTSITELIDCISHLDLLITIDSGPMHIAAAVGTPFVAVVGLGTSPWSIVAPKATNHVAVVANGFQLNEDDIIQAIRPTEVANAALTLLSATRS
ncbi:glycosyltransferase family 9 protein [Pseudoalteromonas mariniglutinosa]|uniref:glycosyltransferase family 9 protein n=1 Tax=Pseudoalteromonas mariniglutinosa TaxID=206042 RepID=UPI00384D80AD